MNSSKTTKPRSALPLQSPPKRRLPKWIFLSIIAVTVAVVGVGVGSLFISLNSPSFKEKTLQPPFTDGSTTQNSEFGLIVEPIKPLAVPEADSDSLPIEQLPMPPIPLPAEKKVLLPTPDLLKPLEIIGMSVNSLSESHVTMSGNIASILLVVNRIEASLGRQAKAQATLEMTVAAQLAQQTKAKQKPSKKKTVLPPFSLASVARWDKTQVAVLNTANGSYSAVSGAEVSGWLVTDIDFPKQQITVSKKSRSLTLSVEQ